MKYCTLSISGSLCLLYNIRCNPMQPLDGALPVPYVPVRVTRSALVSSHIGILMHPLEAEPRGRTSQYQITFIPLSVSLWNDLANPVFDGVGPVGFKIRAITILLARAACSLFCLLLFSLLALYRLVMLGQLQATGRAGHTLYAAPVDAIACQLQAPGRAGHTLYTAPVDAIACVCLSCLWTDGV